MLETCMLLIAHGKINSRKLEWLLNKIGIRSWIGPHCHIKVEYIDSIRPFKEWLQAAPCNYAGGFKEDASGLHAYILLRRQGLDGNLLGY